MTEITGTELDEIQDAEERFTALIERELRQVAREASSRIGEVIVAQGNPLAASPDDMNGIVDSWRRRMSVSILPWLRRYIAASVASQVVGINSALGTTVIGAFDETLVTELLLKGAENRLVGIGNQLWEDARVALSEGVERGASVPELARSVRESANVTAPRATTIARTEVIGASNKSSIEVVRAAGLLNAQKRWIATFDDRVRLSHLDAHAQTVALSEPFDVDGALLDHPGDFNGPPEEVINCRCSIGYEIPDDDEDGVLFDDVLFAAASEHTGAMIALVPTEADVKRLAVEIGEPAEELHMTMKYLGDAVNWNEKQRQALINALSTYDWDHNAQTGALECKAFGLAHWNPFGENPCWVLNIGGEDITDVRAVVDDQLSKLNGEVPLPEIPAQHKPFAAHVCLAYTDDTSPELIEQLKSRIGDVQFDRVRIAFGGEHVDIPLRGTLSNSGSAMAFQEGNVDWYIERDHEECSEERPWAVVKISDGSVEGCHESKEDAISQMRALIGDQAEEREDENDENASVNAAASQAFQDGILEENIQLIEGVAVVEGEWTGDGRQFAPNALTWEDLEAVNVPLQWQKETNHGGINDVTVNVGRLTELSRDGSKILVKGYVDSGSEDGREVVRRLKSRTLGGVSIVADDPEQADVEFVYPEGCEELKKKDDDDVSMEDFEKCFMPNGMIFHSGRIRALTLVDTPAFVEASIKLMEDESTEDSDTESTSVVSEEFGVVDTENVTQLYKWLSPVDINDPQSVAQLLDELEPLLAAGHTITIPDLPPAEWFEEPKELPPFGALTVTDDGRVYGLLAPRDVAHRSYQDKRVTVPTGNVDYSRWMNRETIVEGGQRIRTGVITMDCGHASTDPNRTAQSSMDHYDNACSAVITARVGESKDGVWIAGALLPGVNPTQVSRILACAVSGDWRKHRDKNGWRELVGALLVPVPGFPTPARASVRTDNGQLVASTVPVSWFASGDVPASTVDVETHEPAEVNSGSDNDDDTADSGDSVDNENDVDASTNVDTDLDFEIPSWEEIQRRNALRAQTAELAKKLEAELGIEIGA